MAWWNSNNFRMIQNNTRDIDAAMDVDAWIRELQDFECDVAMFGIGGITSFFPTKLEYQVVSPYLKDGEDKVAEMVEKCHKAGIRVIGRFDFNRTHEKFYEDHKEWYFKAVDGRILRCNDTVTTCINSWYQQEYSLTILREALDRYQLDGIFFNAFGFSNWDYYGNNYGVCHCDNCKRRFAEFSGGMELPKTESPSEPAYAAYEAFKPYVINEVLHRIHDLAQSYGPELAVCTYNADYVDIIRNESNSGVGRPYPFPLMQSSMNVGRVREAWKDKVMGNCVINATDLRWRYSGVPHGLTDIRLYENIAAGAVLDFCINGVFADYPDRASVENAKKVFRYHKKNEKYYGKLQSQARIAVIRPWKVHFLHDRSVDAAGVFKALKEEHLMFDIVPDQSLLDNSSLTDKYSLFILPDVKGIDPKLLPMLRKTGAKAIVLGVTEPLEEAAARDLGLQIVSAETDNAGAYMLTREKDIFRHFPQKDQVFITGKLGFAETAGWKHWLPYITKAWFGPAERAYGGDVTGSGCVLATEDEKLVVVPWNLGELYHQHGYPDHKYILADLIDHIAPEARIIKTTAHPSVEIFWDKAGESMLLQILNLSGFNGTTVEDAIPMYDVRVEVPFSAREAKALNGGSVKLEPKGNGCVVVLEKLERFEAVALA
jgi:hypothetical protein